MLGSRDPARLPPLSGRSLDGRHHNLSDDLREQHTFLVAAFRREQQALVDEWLTIGVLLVDRSGRILAREHGGIDHEKTMRLAAARERSSDDA